MKRFKLQPEPAKWDVRCRQRGLRWLERNPDYERPKSYWTEFENDLYQAFGELCAYSVMWLSSKGEMDHFIPVARLKELGRHHLVYEWSNFRYAAPEVNRRKHNHDVLDPFEVRDSWFKIILPSLQLVLTEKVPKSVREKAEFTIKQLGLRDGESIVRSRQAWFELYRRGDLTLMALKKVAPLIAAAVQMDRQRGRDWRHKA